MSRLRTSFACLLLALALGSTAAATTRPRLVCPGSCDEDDGPQPCDDDCAAACASCMVLHLVAPSTAAGALLLPAPPASRPYFTEPTPLESLDDDEVFHVPKSPLA